MSRVPLIACFLGAALVLGSWADTPNDPTPTATPGGYKFPQAKLLGNLTCASASCHAAGDEGRPGSEYSTWVNGDPHYAAFDALHNDTSRKIARILDVRRSDGSLLPAHENATCLNCHAPDLKATLATHGVGCESCHGPAEHYLTRHYRDDFKSLSRREKAETFGLYPTKSLAFRVQQCASCHVGDATREVNHDLIAAGHPRLAFEYTGYHRSPNYKPHWQESPDFENRAWQIGQVACARSAAELLRVRAANEKAPWPELSEASCFACHQDLTSAKWKPLVSSSRTPGAMPWGTWYFSTLEVALDDAEANACAKRLAKLMEHPTRNRAEVVRESATLVKRLDDRLRQLDENPTTVDEKTRFDRIARKALTEDGQRFRDGDWDGSTQHFLALAALYSAGGKGRDPRHRPILMDLGQSLTFPKGYNSPKRSDPAAILKMFQQLRSVTSDPPGGR